MANTFDLLYGEPWNKSFYDQYDVPPDVFIRVSAVNNGNVVWTGPKVTAGAPLVLGPYQGIRVTGTLNKELVFGTASFGAAPTADNFGGPIVLGQDDAGASIDRCLRASECS